MRTCLALLLAQGELNAAAADEVQPANLVRATALGVVDPLASPPRTTKDLGSWCDALPDCLCVCCYTRQGNG